VRVIGIQDNFDSAASTADMQAGMESDGAALPSLGRVRHRRHASQRALHGPDPLEHFGMAERSGRGGSGPCKELVDMQPAAKQSAKMLAMLPKTAEL
jgi:hypothetical protein